MTKRKISKKSKRKLRAAVIVTIVLIVSIALFQFAPSIRVSRPTQISLRLVDGGGGGYVTTTAIIPTTVNGQPTVTSVPTILGGVPTHVEDTWQEWAITYADGHQEHFSSDVQSITGPLELVTNGEPSVLDLTVPIVLATNDLPQHYDIQSGWKTVISNIPTVTVWANYRPVGAISSDLLSPITFATGDSVGAMKEWTVRIVFSGNAGSVSYPTLNLNGALSGLNSAFIQIGVSIISTSYKSYDYDGLPVLCNGQWAFVITTGPLLCAQGSSTVAFPYGVNFNWSPSNTGTASLTLPTGVLTTCQGTYCFVFTATGNQTVILWQSVTATIVGPKTTVTQIGPPIPTGGNGQGPADLTGWLKGLCNSTPWLAWLCGTWMGWPIWILVAVGLLLLLIILYLLHRRKSSGIPNLMILKA